MCQSRDGKPVIEGVDSDTTPKSAQGVMSVCARSRLVDNLQVEVCNVDRLGPRCGHTLKNSITG